MLSLTVRGSRLTAVLDDEPAPARRKRAPAQRSPHSPGTGRRVCSNNKYCTDGGAAGIKCDKGCVKACTAHMTVIGRIANRQHSSGAKPNTCVDDFEITTIHSNEKGNQIGVVCCNSAGVGSRPGCKKTLHAKYLMTFSS